MAELDDLLEGLRSVYHVYPAGAVSQAPAQPMPVQEALAHVEAAWVAPRYFRRPATQSTYVRSLRRLRHDFGGDTRLISDIPTQTWVDWYMQPSSGNTQLKLRAILRRFFAFAIAEGWMLRDPLVDRRPPPRPHADPVTLTDDEWTRILQTAGQWGHAPARNRLLVLTLRHLALRAGEIRALRWGDLQVTDDHNASLGVDGKGGKRARVPVPTGMLAELLDYRTLVTPQASEPIFPGRTGQDGLSASSVRYLVSRIVCAAGVGRNAWRDHAPRPHTFRHTAAVDLVRRKASLPAIQHFLRHSNLTATSIYTRLPTPWLADEINDHHPLGHARLDHYLWREPDEQK